MQRSHESSHVKTIHDELVEKEKSIRAEIAKEYKEKEEDLELRAYNLKQAELKLEAQKEDLKTKLKAVGVRDFSSMSDDEILALDVASEIDNLGGDSGKNKDEIMSLASRWLDARIEQVQNPTNCEDTLWNYCHVYNNCGGGCVIHQLAYCFIVGFAQNRTTVIGSGFKYLRECESNSWDCAFKPMTRCPVPEDVNQENARYVNRDAKESDRVTAVDLFSRGVGSNFVKWAASDGFHTNTPFFLPPELERIRGLHGDARVWLVGHIEKYLLRLNEQKNKTLMERNKDVLKDYKHPVVGIHVRRTDHGREAPFRELSEYMELAERWFQEHDIDDENKRIYLATDEPEVLKEAKKDYPKIKWLHYEYKGAPSGFVSEFLETGRSSMDGFYSLLSDWQWLSHVDHMVGTSSSQVGRMSYELMQNYHTDASKNFVSLDDPWYFP